VVTTTVFSGAAIGFTAVLGPGAAVRTAVVDAAAFLLDSADGETLVT
jgi:hypothetical protein